MNPEMPAAGNAENKSTSRESVDGLIEESRKYSIRDAAEPGKYFDLHVKNKYYVALVKMVTQDGIKAHYEGWPSKCDRLVRFDAGKIFAFRSHTGMDWIE